MVSKIHADSDTTVENIADATLGSLCHCASSHIKALMLYLIDPTLRDVRVFRKVMKYMISQNNILQTWKVT